MLFLIEVLLYMVAEAIGMEGQIYAGEADRECRACCPDGHDGEASCAEEAYTAVWLVSSHSLDYRPYAVGVGPVDGLNGFLEVRS